ncbi:MAG: rhamnogalacturonan acetylesterase [Patiriisocius sp.]|uniref:rhamnogalacturonan acetylesterase n=1 Tax=Patiriisocius sp. TaxID=2822396 RepID=UPI003EF71238
MKIFSLILFLSVFVFQSCDKKVSISENKIFDSQTIYTIGDSTMADKTDPEKNPERGWCQVFTTFLNSEITLENHAVNGRSTRSFISEKRWDSVHNKLEEGDYVFIQFGHNDQKKNSPERYTNPYTAYRNNLIKFVEETRIKKATPILFTSISRRKFNQDSTLVDTHGAYPLIVRLVANEYNVHLVDLQYVTEILEESYGVEKSKKLHLHFEPNEIAYYPEGIEDNTHLSLLGATEISSLAVKELLKEVPEFQKFVNTKQ